jgi:hypothetical protein
MHVTPHNNEEDIIDNWDYPIPLEKSDNLYQLLEVVASENRRLDLEIESLYDDRFVDSATGRELEKLGRYVGVVRKTGEPDDKLRFRIKGAFISQASDTTYDSFASAAIFILDTSAPAIEIVKPPQSVGPKVVELEVDGSIIEDHPLSVEELTILLNGALSVDARVKIVVGGTFAFEGDDTSLEGFNEGTWSSSI